MARSSRRAAQNSLICAHHERRPTGLSSAPIGGCSALAPRAWVTSRDESRSPGSLSWPPGAGGGGHCGRTRPHGANAVGQCHTSTAGYRPRPVQVGDFPGAQRGSRAPSARAAGCPASGPPPCQDDCAARAVSRSFGATPSWRAQQSVLGGGSWYQRPAAGLHPVRGRGSRCSPPRAGPGDVCGILRASTRPRQVARWTAGSAPARAGVTEPKPGCGRPPERCCCGGDRSRTIVAWGSAAGATQPGIAVEPV
jgi:hypothetical protein